MNTVNKQTLSEVLEYIVEYVNGSKDEDGVDGLTLGDIRIEQDEDKVLVYSVKDDFCLGTLENQENGWDFYDRAGQLRLENVQANI
jgi:hypothetical protein